VRDCAVLLYYEQDKMMDAAFTLMTAEGRKIKVVKHMPLRKTIMESSGSLSRSSPDRGSDRQCYILLYRSIWQTIQMG